MDPLEPELQVVVICLMWVLGTQLTPLLSKMLRHSPAPFPLSFVKTETQYIVQALKAPCLSLLSAGVTAIYYSGLALSQ